MDLNLSYLSPQLKSELFRAHVATLSQKLLPLSTLLFRPPMFLLQINYSNVYKTPVFTSQAGIQLNVLEVHQYIHRN